VDGEATRELVEAPRAIAHRVRVDVLSAAIESRSDPLWLVAGSTALLRFDDGSTRVRAGGRLERRVLARPRIALGVEAMAFERVAGDRDVDRGYWNPRRYAEARAYAALTHEFRPFDLQARVGFGRASETDLAGQRSHWAGTSRPNCACAWPRVDPARGSAWPAAAPATGGAT
jgi:hypothetical protein